MTRGTYANHGRPVRINSYSSLEQLMYSHLIIQQAVGRKCRHSYTTALRGGTDGAGFFKYIVRAYPLSAAAAFLRASAACSDISSIDLVGIRAAPCHPSRRFTREPSCSAADNLAWASGIVSAY